MTCKKFFALLLAVLFLAGMGVPVMSQQALAEEAFVIQNLKTNGLIDPLGVDTRQPEFSWQMVTDQIGAAQRAYHLIVKDETGGVVWDSGKVESAASVGILYEGEPLKPATAYTWSVTVTDQDGKELLSDEAAFETSLLDDTFASWDGAQWIGASELTLDAASKAVFHITSDVQLAEGSSTASLILGANDFRLQNKVFNPWLSEGENYVRVELDFSGASADGGVKINVYRVGYDPADQPDVPFAVVEENEALNTVLKGSNRYEVHHVDIFCTASTLSFTVDDTPITSGDVIVSPLGAAVNTFMTLDPAYRGLIRRHYNSLTADNQMKPESVLDRAATLAQGDPLHAAVDFTRADALMYFARDNGIAMRYHTLVWHNQTPRWFF